MRPQPLKDYYSILQVSHDASADEIKKAFRRLAMLYHPDRSGGMTEERFILAKEARDTLTDHKKKAEYDRRLSGGGSGESDGRRAANHDLSFVKDFIKKKRRPAASGYTHHLKVAIPGKQCSMCEGYGARRDMFGAMKLCKWCGGTGRRRI